MSTPRIAVAVNQPGRSGFRPAGLTGPSMATTDSLHNGNGKAASPAALSGNSGARAEFGPRRIGYGLPCSKCKTYYAADLHECPVCKTKERVSPIAPQVPVVAQSTEELPDPEQLEEEREKFLREFQSQVRVSEMDSNAAHDCSLHENHHNGPKPATICQGCYEQLQERVDLMEASLHIDLKEASQIVYDAVWADPSDPNKTYQNAAQSLLLELRKRAGVKLVLGPLQPLPH